MAFDLPPVTDRQGFSAHYKRTRANSEALACALTPEDWMIQSMTEASPVKWNLAHTSWFFETFILNRFVSDYEPFHPQYNYLFNSYYNQIGAMHPRPERGLLSRPTAQDVLAYRAHVDEALARLIAEADDEAYESIAALVTTGIAHEEQHQELLVTDLKHGLFQNPLLPAAYEDPDHDRHVRLESEPIRWEEMEGGLCQIGANGGFSFDNESPRHTTYLHPFRLAHRPVTNGEFIEFIEDGGYGEPCLWLADAWAKISEEKWRAPLYWRRVDDQWREYTLFGEREVNPAAPLAHVSYYEAAAFAAWADARLPTEFEWEAAASLFPVEGRFMTDGRPRAPLPSDAGDASRLQQLFGDVWEWTGSPYVAYPGYAPPAGAIGEYNGKFMSGQMVLKGGSCATPDGHIRVSYRNFFPPQARWQISGFRLARDA